MNAYPASEKQIHWVTKMIDEKMVSDEFHAEVTEALANGMTSKEAGRYLDILFDRNLPNRPVAGAVTEPGFYRLGEDVYRVVLGRQSGNLYAKKVTAHGFDFEAGKGKMRVLKSDAKMTPEEVRLYGVTTGTCAECSTPLSDPVSVHVGIGPTCGPRVLGKEVYKGLAKEAKLVPHVAEALAAIKVRKAAEKAQAQQLVLA